MGNSVCGQSQGDAGKCWKAAYSLLIKLQLAMSDLVEVPDSMGLKAQEARVADLLLFINQ